MKLFTVGPVMMDPETLEIGANPLPYFRTAEFSKLMCEIEYLMKKFVGTNEKSKISILTASGTAAMEASIINLFNEKDKLLIVNGGSFGERFVQICQIHNIPFSEIKLNFGEELKSDFLQQYDNDGFTGLVCNIHETSTGQLYPIDILSDFSRRNNLFFVVDAISSFLADEFYMDKWSIDATILSSQKSLALPPGLSFVIFNERSLSKQKNIKVKSLYLNLNHYFIDMLRGQTPFTPAVGIIFQLHDKLNRIDQSGINYYLEQVQSLAGDFRCRLSELNFILPSYPLSSALTPIICPLNNAYDIFSEAKDLLSLFVTPSGGELSSKLLRIGHLGNLTVEDNKILIDYLSTKTK